MKNILSYFSVVLYTIRDAFSVMINIPPKNHIQVPIEILQMLQKSDDLEIVTDAIDELTYNQDVDGKTLVLSDRTITLSIER